MSFIVHDIQDLYRQVFGGKPYKITGKPTTKEESPFRIDGNRNEEISETGNALTANYLGKEIWLPVTFTGLNPDVFGTDKLLLPYSVIKITGKKTVVKTPLAERKGTVKELYNIDDYAISIKGFVIDEDKRVWPEKDLTTLKKLWELNEAIQLDNALTNIFLDKDTRVVIESIDFPEVEGGKKHIRPFSMSIESDSVFTLEIDDNV